MSRNLPGGWGWAFLELGFEVNVYSMLLQAAINE